MLNKNFCGVYRIQSLSTGMVYFGSAKNMVSRRDQHLRALVRGVHHNYHLQALFNTYGVGDLKFSVVKRYVDKSAATAHEEQLILKHRLNPQLMNVSLGTNGGDNLSRNPNRDRIIKRMTSTTQARMNLLSAADKQRLYGQPKTKNGMHGRTHTEEVKKRLSDVAKGNQWAAGAKRSQEVKDKLSEIASARTGQLNPFYGRHHSKESRRKQAEAKFGRKPPNSFRVSINGTEYASLEDAAKGECVSVYYIKKWIASDECKECKRI